HPLGMRDWLAVKALDPGGFGCVLTAPLPREESCSPALARRWGRVAAHLAAGFRIRRGLARGGGTGAAADPLTGADAILGSSFRVEHARGPAEKREARAMLRDAAVAIDRARASL